MTRDHDLTARHEIHERGFRVGRGMLTNRASSSNSRPP